MRTGSHRFLRTENRFTAPGLGVLGSWGLRTIIERSGRFWEALAASVRLCKALDALEGFGGFISLWQVWKALGSFDVNMVCPLPGSWINHVPVRAEAQGSLLVVGLRP